LWNEERLDATKLSPKARKVVLRAKKKNRWSAKDIRWWLRYIKDTITICRIVFLQRNLTISKKYVMIWISNGTQYLIMNRRW
jgi:hypothetical protein